MSWISSAHVIEDWGCVVSVNAYHRCLLDTYSDSIEYPFEIRIKLREWPYIFIDSKVLYMKFVYDNNLLKIWSKN